MGRYRFQRWYLVAPSVVAVELEAGVFVPGRQTPYERHAGDVITEGVHRWVIRDGKWIGALVGSAGDTLFHAEHVTDLPDEPVSAWLDMSRWRVTVSRGAGKPSELRPGRIYRKTRPTNFAQHQPFQFQATLLHTLYLELPQPIPAGAVCTLSHPLLSPAQRRVRFDAAQVMSEAVHVSHVGYHPEASVKLGTISCWRGDGGGQPYPATLPVSLVEDRTGRVVWRGQASRRMPEPEDVYKRDYTRTPVLTVDFGAFRRTGRYRLVAEGIGCSLPFRIAPDVWRTAHRIITRGLYYQRSGIAIQPPHSDGFRRPRAFHPDDGVRVTASTCSLMDSGNGLNARGLDTDNFGCLVKGRTDTPVPDAWGGYFDAGDWDRRIQHLDATRLLLELDELHPDYCQRLSLNIPTDDPRRPDLLTEAMWSVDCYRRMQLPDGAIRGGIESEDHPRYGEASWQESLRIMAYAPDPWSSWLYAATAARLARRLIARNRSEAEVYASSAARAMRWADAQADTLPWPELPHQVRDSRNLAAVEMYRLTRDAAWLTLFETTSVFTGPRDTLSVWKEYDQAEAAFSYLCDPSTRSDAPIAIHARRAFDAAARLIDASAKRSLFGWVKESPYRPVGWGLMTVPDCINLLRAEWLDRRNGVHPALWRAFSFTHGCNPLNLCFTTGLGARSPRHALYLDARVTGQSPPPGITVLGPIDPTGYGSDHWELKLIAQHCWPRPDQWPATEFFFDVFWLPMQCEYTVMQNIGPMAYLHGCIAARLERR